jgi:hypothetical protein
MKVLLQRMSVAEIIKEKSSLDSGKLSSGPFTKQVIQET